MRGNSGQIVLVILLIMIVGLTIGLAVIARSVTNLKISTQTEESQRAFSAAEAGIEGALGGIIASDTTSTIGGATYTVDFIDLTNYSQELKKGEIATIWLVAHNADGTPQLDVRYYSAPTIDICWSGTGTGPIPALEMTVIYKTQVGPGGKYKVARAPYDPDGSRLDSNKFLGINNTGNCSLSYKHQLKFFSPYPEGLAIPGTPVLEAIHLKALYNDATVEVKEAGGAGATLPAQGKEIVSEGKMGQTVRKIKTIRTYPALPEIFDYALFSGTDLTK